MLRIPSVVLIANLLYFYCKITPTIRENTGEARHQCDGTFRWEVLKYAVPSAPPHVRESCGTDTKIAQVKTSCPDPPNLARL
jgi:hypothetical protein